MIQIKHLTKEYGTHKVVSDVSFDIEEGICTALVGPNGAGKSTLIDMIIGDRHPHSGTIKDTSALLDAKYLGVMFQRTAFPDSIKVIELYRLFAHLYEHPISELQFKHITNFTDQQLHQMANDLSGGQRRILDFALSLVGQPQCLILDEPTSAMDVEMRYHFWTIVSELKNTGVTLFYTSHYIEEVERMADRVVVLNEGRIVMNDSLRNIKLQQKISVIEVPASNLKIGEALSNATVHDNGNYTCIETTHVQHTLVALINLGINLNDITIHKNSLLEIVFKDEMKRGDAS